jgi:hypothetical protein
MMAFSIKNYTSENIYKIEKKQHTSVYSETSNTELKCDINDYEMLSKQKGKNLKYIKCVNHE